MTNALQIPAQKPSRRRFLLGAFSGLGATAAFAGGSAWHQSVLDTQARRSWAQERLPIGPLPKIPVFDARELGAVGYAKARVNIMRELLEQGVGPLTPAAALIEREMDAVAARWIERSHSPYFAELRAIDAMLEQRGVFLLNTSYEWGCTALAAPSRARDSAVLFRTLDWSLNGLGKHVELVRQRGAAGEFFNVTWPGAVGVLTAMAPGRFAASINQGPILRRFHSESLLSLDEWMNTYETYMNVEDQPSMHVLREVFEGARDFAEARAQLEKAPVASPTIFTLVGLTAAETCVIERDRRQFKTQLGVASAANDWRYGTFAGQWEGQGADAEEPHGDSARRSALIESFAGHESRGFDWVRDPILNGATRLAVEANPRLGRIRVRGYESTNDEESAEPVTATLDFHA